MDTTKSKRPFDFIRPIPEKTKHTRADKPLTATEERLRDKRSLYIDDKLWTALKIVAAKKRMRTNRIVEDLIRKYLDSPDAL